MNLNVYGKLPRVDEKNLSNPGLDLTLRRKSVF